MDNPFSLEGKKILVTGASSGIGYETCRRINLQGGTFIATARREKNLEKLLLECNNSNHSAIRADIADDKEIDQLVNNLNGIDGIVHSAGIVSLAPVKYYNDDLLNSMRSVNYDSIVKIVNLLSKRNKLNRNGSIVLISSISALFGMNGNGIYAGTKGALISIAKVWANELSRLRIRVNCVSPGMVKTDITNRSIDDLSLEVVQNDQKKYPLGYGEPEQVANPIIFLLSDASSWITGQNLILDGGRTACI